jgi:hypothetical protein
MLEIFKKAEAAPVAASEPVPKFSQSDIAFTKRDTEKVTILGLAKKRETVSETYVDFGIEYIIRGADNRSRPIYEFELMDLDEACNKIDTK